MNLPYIQNVKSRGVTFTQEFRGYNHNLRTEQGEFYDMENISLDDYPVIGTRHGFGARYLEFQDFLEEGDSHGIHEYKENTLMAVFGKTLHVGITADSDGWIVSNSTTLLSDSEKTFATIGTKTLIMPDKVVYDHAKNTLVKVEQRFQWDSIEVETDYKYLMLRTIPCDVDGKHQNKIVESGPDDDEFQPANPTDGMWWYRGYTKEWLEYKADGTRWVKVEKPYTRLIPVLSNGSDIFTMWTNPTEAAKGELVALNNFFGSLNVLDSFNLAMVSMDSGIYLEDAEHKDCVIYGKTKEWQTGWNIDLYTLVISGMPNTNLVIFEINIKCPELRHIFALNNRVWGVTPNRVMDPEDPDPERLIPNPQEIFCCKLGDLTQWYDYAGTAADSFAVSLGNDNEITAGCAFNNTPHFFTEDAVIKIYGDYPSNYQMRSNKADGVVSGGHKTLVQLEGVLMWVSPIGVMMYDGSQPYFRGEKFSPHFLDGKKIAGGKDGAKYCLSVSHSGTSDGVFMYDTKTGLWAKTADGIIVMASELKNALCYVNDSKQLVTLYDRTKTDDDVPGDDPEPIAWSLETGNLGLDSPYQKYISRIQLRADFIGTFLVDISYDDSEYMPVYLAESDHMHSITVPIKVRRNDHFKIRMTGTGQMRLYSFGYETDEGSTRCLI